MTTLALTKTCTEPDCDRPYHGRGLCQRHYQRLHKRGLIGRPVVDTDEVLWLLDGGRPVPSICDALDRHPDTIARALTKAGHAGAARLFANEAALRKRLGRAVAA